jgi:predicted Zn-dependent peptidase
MEEVEKFKKNGPTEAQLNTVKETARNQYEVSLKTNSYWLGRFQVVSMWGQDPRIIAARKDRINALTTASVKDAFNKYFPADRTTVVTLMPRKP